MELGRVGGGERREVGGPAHHGLPVGMRGEGRGQELLDQPADRLALGAHPPLLVDDVALLVEVAHHRLQVALRLEVGPELQPVGGEGEEVAGLVGVGEGVQAHAALAVDDLAELVLHHVGVGLGDPVLPRLLELGDLLVVAPDALAALRVVGGVGRLDRLERRLLLRVVGGPDAVGALEGHVLEHVGEAGDAGHLAVAAHVHVGEEGEDRRLGALAHEQREAVRERLDAHLLLEGGQVLGGGGMGDGQGEHGEGGQRSSHRYLLETDRTKRRTDNEREQDESNRTKDNGLSGLSSGGLSAPRAPRLNPPASVYS